MPRIPGARRILVDPGREETGSPRCVAGARRREHLLAVLRMEAAQPLGAGSGERLRLERGRAPDPCRTVERPEGRRGAGAELPAPQRTERPRAQLPRLRRPHCVQEQRRLHETASS